MLQYLLPGLFAIFAAAFGGLAPRFPALTYLRPFALAFLSCGLGLLIQIAWVPADENLNSLISTACYLGGAQLIAEGALRRSRRTMGWPFHLVAFAVPMLATAYFLFVTPHLIARVYILNFGFGVILLCAAWRDRKLARGSVADRMLFWTLVVVGLHFFPRTLMTAASFAATDLPHGETLFWITLQYAVGLLATAGALVLAGLVAYDIISAIARQRDTDPLTGLLNRRGLDDRMALVARRGPHAERAVIVADLDHFKSVNDRFGHAAGDRVLQVVAQRMRRATGQQDLVARIGGEEFVVVLGASLDAATRLAERIRLAIETEPVAVEGATVRVTASFGVAPMGVGEDFWQVVRLADRGMYGAKDRGRNEIHVETASSAIDQAAC